MNRRAAGFIGSRTKVRVPCQKLMDRARLIATLDTERDARLVLVHAPAGYGKTSLLQQWAIHLQKSGASVGWLSFDTDDRDPLSFLQHLIQSFEEAGHRTDPQLNAAVGLEGGHSWRTLVTTLANSFIDVSHPFYLFFDDAHLLNDAVGLRCLETLIDQAPRELHLVIASREQLGIPLGRLRVVDRVAEISSAELRFAPTETASYMEHEGHHGLTNAQERLLHERTEGWIAGIKVFSLAMRGDPENAQLLATFTGERRQIADYFAEEVLARQSVEMQDFLLRSSIFSRLSPSFCDAVLGLRHSRRLLDQCEAAGLFLTPLDHTRDWYRYHHLFSAFLQRQLRDRAPGICNELYQKACDWLLAAGCPADAFDYALKSNNFMRAADILDTHCEAMWSAGQQQTVQQMAARIPAHIQFLYPRPMLLIAWRLIARWKLNEARELVAISRARVAEIAQGPDSAAWLQSARCMLLHRESQLAHATYALTTLEKQCSTLLRDFGSSATPYLLLSTYISLQYAQREQYRLDKIEQLDRLALEQSDKVGYPQGHAFCAAITGGSYLLAGRSDKAIEVLSSGLRTAEALVGTGAPLGAIAAVPLAAVHYARNEITAARELLDRYLPVFTAAGFVDQLATGWITHSRLLRLGGDWARACSVLEDATEFARRYELDLLRVLVAAEHVRLLLQLGRPDDAIQLARRCGFASKVGNGRASHRPRFTVQGGAVALAWCHLEAAQNRVSDSLALARQWRSFVTAAGAVQSAIEWDVLVAELLLMSGDPLAAQRVLAQAVNRAAPGRYFRSFLDAGNPIGTQLHWMARDQQRSNTVDDAFLQELAAQVMSAEEKPTSTGPVPALCGPLSNREIQILTLVSRGLANRDIGTKLGLTEGTVKWYLRQTFDKVRVRDRFQAANKVRELGLMK